MSSNLINDILNVDPSNIDNFIENLEYSDKVVPTIEQLLLNRDNMDKLVNKFSKTTYDKLIRKLILLMEGKSSFGMGMKRKRKTKSKRKMTRRPNRKSRMNK